MLFLALKPMLLLSVTYYQQDLSKALLGLRTLHLKLGSSLPFREILCLCERMSAYNERYVMARAASLPGCARNK
jgi:hypothetical protein